MNEDIDYTQGIIEEANSRLSAIANECLLDPSVEYGEPRYVFTQNGIGFGPLGDIQMIKAPQKNGKTFLFSLMMGALLKGEYLGLKCEIENPRVLYIDTEQHPRNTQMVYRRACYIGGIPGRELNPNFKAYHFRGKSPQEILDTMLYLIDEFKPSVVFLDGVRDCVEDFNDLKESKEICRILMDKSLSADCSIWSIIHVNPGSDKARGHLGTEMQNKCSDVLTCLKEKNDSGTTFTVEQTDARNRDINKFSFEIQSVTDSPNHYIAIPVPTHISIKTRTVVDETMAKALSDCPLRWSDLKDKVMEIAECCEKTAKTRIKEASESGIIAIDSVTSKYRYVGLDLKNEPDCPF